jgi:hypothetical protein
MQMFLKSALIVVGLASVAGVAFAQPREFKPPAPQVAPALDKIAMTDFVCDPSPIPPGTTQVKLTVTVKNLTSGPQAVTINGPKLRVLRTNPQPDVLELETTIVSLAPGATQSVSQKVNVGPGVREYFARVDVDDTLHEPIVQRANNEKRLRLTIPQVSGQQAPAPGSQPQLETQVLDYQKAKRAGAQFAHAPDGAAPCPMYGQFYDPNHLAVGPPPMPFTVRFYMDCAGSPLGMRATPETFGNFRLKHGWKVKSVELLQEMKRSADWQWRQRPDIGSDNPAMRMHLWSNPNGTVHVIARVTIEGPAGTNPYE